MLPTDASRQTFSNYNCQILFPSGIIHYIFKTTFTEFTKMDFCKINWMKSKHAGSNTGIDSQESRINFKKITQNRLFVFIYIDTSSEK